MAVTYGFFNSVNGDRVYNADQMSEYFKGLIGDGVFESVGSGLQVVQSDPAGMSVTVRSGRAVIDCRWLDSDAAETLTISAAHQLLGRVDSVVIHLDYSARTIDLRILTGTAASSPLAPVLTNTAAVKELRLANIYVAAASTSITTDAITDTRSSSDCGWVTGLVDQVDTSTLFEQWAAAYASNIAEMESWEDEQKTAFENWLATLTQQLQIGAYIRSYKKTATISDASAQTITLDMAGYSYENTDVINVFINGLKAAETDYTLNTSGTPSVTFALTAPEAEDVEIQVLKSILGVSGA